MSVHRYWNNGVLYEIIDGILRRQVPKSDGIARSWHANRVLAKEMTLVNGLAEGVCYEWHDNGEMAVERPYKQGLEDGTVRQWNKSGKLLV
jgi:antitoxin component YwqK of YwqJK toxin-antitoxin module